MTPIVRIDKIELVSINKLKEHPENTNKHPDEQIERLAEIIKYQGWRQPIKVSNQTGFITAGHGRLAAAKLLGLTEVPVSYQDYDSPDQEMADVTSDNAIALWAELDLSKINMQLESLGPDFDINLLGIKDFVLEPSEKLDINNSSTELNLDSFDNFQHECPKCGFEWNDNGTT